MFLLSHIVFEMSGFFLSDSLRQLFKAGADFITHPSELGDDFFRCPRERIGVVKADMQSVSDFTAKERTGFTGTSTDRDNIVPRLVQIAVYLFG